MFVYELSGCGFKSCCCHLHIFLSIKKIVFWQLLQKADDFNQTPPPGSSKQSLGKSITKAKWALPKHTPVKAKVISNLVTQLLPHSKTSVFSSAWRSLNKPGWPPKKTTEVWDCIVRFLEKPGISYFVVLDEKTLCTVGSLKITKKCSSPNITSHDAKGCSCLQWRASEADNLLSDEGCNC